MEVKSGENLDFYALLYSFGFNAYIDNIEGLIENINSRKINFIQFTNKNALQIVDVI